MKFYITFGQSHPHRDRYHVIEATSRIEAMEKAMQRFGRQYSMCYSESEWWLTATETQAERYGLCELK